MLKVGDTFRVKSGPKGEKEVKKYRILQILPKYVVCEHITYTGKSYKECFPISDFMRREGGSC